MAASRAASRRRTPPSNVVSSLCELGVYLPLPFVALYVVLVLAQLHILLRSTTDHWPPPPTVLPPPSSSLPTSSSPLSSSSSAHFSSSPFSSSSPPSAAATGGPPMAGPAALNASLHAEYRLLCRHRRLAARTILMHMHIPKSGGTAFALALASECRCRHASRPKKGYCKECPHVLPDASLPPAGLRGRLWTAANATYAPPYTHSCRTYAASSRWFGFPARNRTETFYSQNRLTSGWPCGVHVGYARLRMCARRLRLRGVRHVVVSVFREPAARLVSEFFQVAFNRRVITSWDWCANPVPPLDLSAFLASSVDLPFQSRVTKLLSGSPVQTGAAGEPWAPSPAHPRAGDARKRALARALDVVRNADDLLFGLAERLDDTLQLLEFAFRRRFRAPSRCHSHQNSSGCAGVQLGIHDRHGRPMEMSDQQWRLFRENNAEDVAVYDAAVEVFERRVAAMRDLQALGSDWAIDRRCASVMREEDLVWSGEDTE